MTMNQEGYPVFKGLQKPLEFMGIRGRFLTLAAAAIGVSFVGFIGFSIALGKLAGFIAMLVMAVVGLVTITSSSVAVSITNGGQKVSMFTRI